MAGTVVLCALIPVGIPFHYVIAGFMTVISVTTSLLLNRWHCRPIWLAFFVPIGSLIMVFLIWRSGLLGTLRGGVYWRGTFYPR
jgi:hypothetical protein